MEKERGTRRTRVAKNLIRGQTCNNCKHYHYSLETWGSPTQGRMKVNTKGVMKIEVNKNIGPGVHDHRKEKEYCERITRRILGYTCVKGLPEIRTCEKWKEQT